jgi:Family of unknown function (DUF6186)
VTSRSITFAGFAVIVGVMLVWAAFSARRAHRPDSVTLARAVGALTRTKWGRVMMLLVWAWLGLHLFARGSGAFK